MYDVEYWVEEFCEVEVGFFVYVGFYVGCLLFVFVVEFVGFD